MQLGRFTLQLITLQVGVNVNRSIRNIRVAVPHSALSGNNLKATATASVTVRHKTGKSRVPVVSQTLSKPERRTIPWR